MLILLFMLILSVSTWLAKNKASVSALGVGMT